VTLFMSLPPEAAAARGGFGEERYEDAAFQEQARGGGGACLLRCWRRRARGTSTLSGHCAEAGRVPFQARTLAPLPPPNAPPPISHPQVRAAFAAVRDASFVDIDASRGVDAVAAAVLAEATEAVRRAAEGQPVRALWDYGPLPAAQ
jgi:hypothetical protein